MTIAGWKIGRIRKRSHGAMPKTHMRANIWRQYPDARVSANGFNFAFEAREQFPSAAAARQQNIHTSFPAAQRAALPDSARIA